MKHEVSLEVTELRLKRKVEVLDAVIRYVGNYRPYQHAEDLLESELLDVMRLLAREKRRVDKELQRARRGIIASNFRMGRPEDSFSNDVHAVLPHMPSSGGNII